MKYRKKPVVIEAIQWTGLNFEEIKAFVGQDLIYDIYDAAWKVGMGIPEVTVKIKTLEGEMLASVGDYIIQGVDGEFYPCKPDIFEKTYDIVNEENEPKSTTSEKLYYIENQGCDATTYGLVRISDKDFPKFKSFVENLNKNSYYSCMPVIHVYEIDMNELREFTYNPDLSCWDEGYIDKDEVLYLNDKTYTFREGHNQYDYRKQVI